MNRIGTQRINGNRGRQGTVDSTGHAQDNARKTILLNIIAQPQNHGAIDRFQPFRRGGLIPWQTFPASIRPFEGRNRHATFVSWHLNCQAEICIHDKGRPVIDQFVLSPDLIQIGQRQATFRDPFHHQLQTYIFLGVIIGAAIGDQQYFCTGFLQTFNNIGCPDILTDRHANAHASNIHRPRQRAGLKHTLFIENAIIWQVIFIAFCHDATAR